MIRFACIALFATLTLSAASALAAEPERSEVITASVLMDRLAEEGLRRAQSELTSRSQDRQTSSDKTCERACDTKFVKGFESCSAVMAKFIPSDEKDTALNTCGEAALSGLNVCQSACSGTISEGGSEEALLKSSE